MSFRRDLGDTAGDIFNDSSRTLAPAAVGAQVAIMGAISVRYHCVDINLLAEAGSIDCNRASVQFLATQEQGAWEQCLIGLQK